MKNKAKIFAVITTLALLLGAFAVGMLTATAAETDGQGLQYTLNADGQSYSVTKYTGTATEVVIPGTYGGKAVTEIGTWAFSNCSSLTSITIPDSVTSIGIYAFDNCSSLTSITVEDGNTVYHSTGNCLIETASKTLKVGCNNSVIPTDGSVTSIGNYAFYYRERLTSISIPEGVTSIGNYAFSVCNLTSISIPNSVTSIGYNAFYYCKSLTSVTFGESSQLTSIGNQVFSNCSNLTSITIPEGVTSIGDCAFYGTAIQSIHIPASVISLISNNANPFGYCRNLTTITVAKENPVFHAQNNNLIETATKTLIASAVGATIPVDGSVTKIGSGAFAGRSDLKEINIPECVTSIALGAFADCSGITEVEDGISYVDGWVIDADWSISTTALRVNTVGIADEAFTYCVLTSITIPENVTSIGRSAFQGCSSLTSITIPEGVTSIETCTFYDCSSLTSITIPESVTSIGDSAFSNCSSMTSITFGNNSQLTSIGDSAFQGCSNLTSITIPENVTSIGDGAFDYCSSLTSITLPDDVTSIGDGAFWFCSSLMNITIPDSVTSIGIYAFDNCSSLTSVTIPESVTSVGDYAFSFCSNLTSVTFGDNSQLVSIGQEAFYGCISLASITIPEKVTSIGMYAFSDCHSLTNITFLTEDVAFEYDTIPSFAVIYAYKGSTAHLYAHKYNIEYELLEDKESIGTSALYGDANGDGVINGQDLLLLRKYLANFDYTTGESTIVLGPGKQE